MALLLDMLDLFYPEKSQL